jgi:hypothetical protein
MEASIKKDFLLILTGFPGKPGMTAAEGHLSGRTKCGMTGIVREEMQ